jgi:hypothetical protein
MVILPYAYDGSQAVKNNRELPTLESLSESRVELRPMQEWHDKWVIVYTWCSCHCRSHSPNPPPVKSMVESVQSLVSKRYSWKVIPDKTRSEAGILIIASSVEQIAN